MKIFLFTLGIAIIVICFIVIKVNYLNPQKPNAETNGHVFSLYLATTSKDQETGLSKFNKIGKDQGMLFIFQTADYYSFWMRDMHFPIDIIFINKNKIVDIFKKAPVIKNGKLPIYTTHTKADKVLEINSGLSDEYKIKIGDKININL